MLPPGVELVRPGTLARRTEGLVAAYRLNLAVLSAIALFVGMFLISQSVTLSVVRRRREIGLLRTLGMTPGGRCCCCFWPRARRAVWWGAQSGRSWGSDWPRGCWP